MTGDLQADPRDTSPPPSSSLARISSAVVAIASQLLLLDAAIETFLAGAPLRWWVSPSAVLFVLLSAWVWKPGEVAARRWGWPGAAAWSVGGLCLLLTATAWLPNGQTDGVRLLGQPTGTVLTAALAAAIVLAAYALVRTAGVLGANLRLAARAVVILLALYGLTSLAIGLTARTPFADLFQGGAAWQAAPRWLQGAFVGAFVLVPLALLGQIVRATIELRRGLPMGAVVHQTTALLMACVMAASGLVLPASAGSASSRSASGLVLPGSLGSARATAPGSTGTSPAGQGSGGNSGGIDPAFASAPAPYAPPARPAPASLEEAASRLSTAMTLAQGLTDAVDPALLDVAVRARTFGKSIDEPFTWVRDHVRFEPYRGILRGPQGALIALAANAADRSLLLADLLRRGGHKVRLATGDLPERARADLLAAWTASAPAAPDGPTDEAARQLLERAGGPDAVSRAQEIVAYGDAMMQWVRQRARADADGLSMVLGPEGQWFTDTAWQRLQDSVQPHVWVQVEREGQWIDLDSSFPAATPGQTFAVAAATFDPGRPPAELLHTITFTINAEYGDASSRSVQKLLQKTMPTGDLVLDQVRISNVPAGASSPEALSRVNAFRPSLQVGDRRTAGSEFQLVQKPSAPDIGGALFGGESSSAARELTAVWLDITLAGPGAPPRAERRYLVDRVGLDARAGGNASLTSIPTERMPYLLLREYDVLVMAAPHPRYLASWLGCRQLLRNRRLLEQAVAVRFGGADPKSLESASGKASQWSLPLLALAGEVARELRASREGARLVLSEPFVAMVKHGFAVRSVLEDPVGLARLEEGIDIVGTGAVPAGGTPVSRARTGLAFGTFLTSLELAYARAMASPSQPLPSNASLSFERARSAKQPILAVRQAADEQAIGADGDRLAALRTQRERGYVPITAVADRSSSQAAPDSWWRLDPASGVVLGVRESGEGQGMSERAQLAINFAAIGWCQLKNWSITESRMKEGKKDVAAFYVMGQVACLTLGGIGVGLIFGAELFWGILAFTLGAGGDIIGLY